MKTIIILIVILITLFNVTNVKADSITPHVAGHKANSHMPVHFEKHTEKVCREILGEMVCLFKKIMQDLTQCTLTTSTHELVCVDTCGGLSIPGTVCSNE